jgi:hypothetical protein
MLHNASATYRTRVSKLCTRAYLVGTSGISDATWHAQRLLQHAPNERVKASAMLDSGNPLEHNFYLDVDGGVKLQCQISRSTSTGTMRDMSALWTAFDTCCTPLQLQRQPHHYQSFSAPTIVSVAAGAGPVSSSVGLVVFHPWSWLGGCMDDAVVSSIYRYTTMHRVTLACIYMRT